MYTEIVYAHTSDSVYWVQAQFDCTCSMNLGHDEFNIYIVIIHEISPFMSAYASSEGPDEPVHPRKMESALFC